MVNRKQARSLLREALRNRKAKFRAGQWDAIDRLVNGRERLLVVERTGWGKSLVYFIATRLLRARGYGPTLIVCPLLALMRDQILEARRMDVNAITFNSANDSETGERTCRRSWKTRSMQS
ncbi:MAG: DEAD/DEAH box helicase family protein [Alphaproteobacteria bacterium]|nr:DEAD/DEAH box helicase family protein [Alphaproteobacteria bacterium]